MNKNDFYELFLHFCDLSKDVREMYFRMIISLGLEIKTDLKKPANVGKHDLFL